MSSNLLWQPKPIRLLPLHETPEEAAERRKTAALLLCQFAQNRTSWQIANRLAQAWDCGGCQELGVRPPE